MTKTPFVRLSLDCDDDNSLTVPPQWGAADAKIKVPSGENAELKRSPFKTWSRSVVMNATLTAKDFFLAYFCPSGPFICIFPPKTSLDFSASV